VSNPLTRTLRAYAADARSAFRSAPVEVALGVLLAVALSVETRSKAFTEMEFARIAASVALAFPLVFALSVLAARGVVRPAARWGATLAIVIACALFGWLGLHEDREADWWRWGLLAVVAVLLLTMTPALPWRERDRRRSWAFTWRFVVRAVGIGLYAGALYAVLAGAVGAVVSLFELKQPEHLYTDLAGAVFFCFAPWILVGGIHRISGPAPEGVPETVSRLGRWLYAPVLVVYLAVLYAYAVKVLVTGELPRNLVSPLVIAAGLIGLVCGALLYPVHDDEEHRGLSLLVRAIPALLLPLVPLGMWALAARLGEYGWTEFRYVRLAVLLAIGILALLGTVRLLRRRPPLFSTVPAVFAAVLLLAALGPWSAPAVSLRDQTDRLRTTARAAGLDPRRVPGDTVRVDSAAYARITSGARYLLTAHGIAALQAVFPAVPDTTRSAWDMGERLNILSGCRPPERVVSELAWGPGVRLPAGGTLSELEVAEGKVKEVSAGGGLRVELANDRLRVRGEGWTAETDLVPLLRRLREAQGLCRRDWDRSASGPALTPSDAVVVLRDPSGAARGQVVVTRYIIDTPREGSRQQAGVHVRELSGLLVIL